MDHQANAGVGRTRQLEAVIGELSSNEPFYLQFHKYTIDWILQREIDGMGEDAVDGILKMETTKVATLTKAKLI